MTAHEGQDIQRTADPHAVDRHATQPAIATAAGGMPIPGSVPGALADAAHHSVAVARIPGQAAGPGEAPQAGGAWGCRDLGALAYALFALAEPVPLHEVRPPATPPAPGPVADAAFAAALGASLDARPRRDAVIGEISALNI